MTDHLWVVQAFYGGKWCTECTFSTRSFARAYQSAHFGPGASRIRKYVPA